MLALDNKRIDPSMIFNFQRHQDAGASVILMPRSYDRDAPTKVGARHTPSFVLIRCAVFVRGLTQAASLVSRVVKPYERGIV